MTGSRCFPRGLQFDPVSFCQGLARSVIVRNPFALAPIATVLGLLIGVVVARTAQRIVTRGDLGIPTSGSAALDRLFGGHDHADGVFGCPGAAGLVRLLLGHIYTTPSRG